MHLFYTPDIVDMVYTLSAEESKHCVRVLRLMAGDEVVLVDGQGNWYNAVIGEASPRACRVECYSKKEKHGCRPFRLHLAVAPTKNIDRTEWMLEKCTEMGVDEITMLATRYSERKVTKDERLEKVLVAAMKQSLKAYVPHLNPMTDFKEFVVSCREKYKFIAHCREGEKKHLSELYCPGEDVVVLIGPEGDFSEEEVTMAEAAGFIAVTLGASRLRTETAGMVACHSVNFMNNV